jgi:hypothetical protein
VTADLGPMTNVHTGMVEPLPPLNPSNPLLAGLRAIGSAANSVRALEASADYSGLGNQGGIISVTHPIISARAAGAMLRSTFSPKVAEAITKEIDDRQMAKYGDPDYYNRVGLDRTNSMARTAAGREEAFPPSPLENVPGIGGVIKSSDRTYSIVLDRQRADTFDALHDGLRSIGKVLGDNRPVSPAEAQTIARYINIATGRGHFGEGPTAQAWKDAMPAMANVFFSPRYQMSKIQFGTLVPLWGAMSPRARTVIGLEYAKYITAQAAFLGAAQASGQADVDTDPRSTNFLKAKLKGLPLDLDPLGSARGYLVLAARLGSPTWDRLHGEEPRPNFVNQNGDESSKSGLDLLAQFGGNKLAPAARFVVKGSGRATGARAFQMLPGRNDSGEFGSGEAVGLVTPIGQRQLAEDIANSGGDPAKIQALTAAYLLNLFGAQSSMRKENQGSPELDKILAGALK